MSLKELITDAVSHAFGISISNPDLERLQRSSRISEFPSEFNELLGNLNDERCSEKILARSLEAVIVLIKLKPEASKIERKFQEEIERLVYAPQYEEQTRCIP
ncbi:hypothetical protein [Legionella yabuuchiae]|uniref:hypothetical protein n=1 Tax=Legionella yabuuchiae TaxID=376727 RepID=UPI001055955C|nr:hypothetical protein [Legionella yabuuchiae]